MDSSDPAQCTHTPIPEDLVADLAAELREVAGMLLASERPGHTLQPTALIHELWIRMASSGNRHFDSREAFFVYASRAIRHILVDHARRKGAAKRGGGWARHDSSDLNGECRDLIWSRCMLEIEDEIKSLEKTQKSCAEVFELRFFGGMSLQQIADWLDVPVRMVRDDWHFARAWFATRIGPGPWSATDEDADP